MISYREALQKISAACARLDTETLPLADALGRSPVHDLASNMDVPSFANSAMDGFALRAEDCRSATDAAPVSLPVAGTAAAGQPPLDGPAGQAIEIMTGAPVPHGYDTVVPVERVTADRNDDGRALSVRLIQPCLPISTFVPQQKISLQATRFFLPVKRSDLSTSWDLPRPAPIRLKFTGRRESVY